MQFCHDSGTINFEIKFGPALVSKSNKTGPSCVGMIPMASSALYVLAQNSSAPVFSSKGIRLMLRKSTDDGRSQVLLEIMVCGTFKRSDSNDAPSKGLVFAVFTFRTSSASNFFAVLSPLLHVEVACYTRSLLVRALAAVLNSARFPASTQT